METIDNYLDTMFSAYPYTPRAIEAKAELRAMMEDIFNGAIAAGRTRNEAIGQALSEFGNIEELALGLGLDPMFDSGNSTLPSQGGIPEIELTAPLAQAPVSNRPAISLAQARNFTTVYHQTRWMQAWGIAIFVLAPIPLVSLTLAASNTAFFVSPPAATVIGLSVLLPSIAIGVGLLVWRGQKLQPFSLITQGTGRITPEVEAFAAGTRRKNASAQAKGLIAGITLWILSALPIIAAGTLTEDMPQTEADRYLAAGLASTLILVAAGLLAFLPANWSNAAASRLTEDALSEARASSGLGDTERYPTWVRATLAGYWPAMAAIYLAWSFIGGSWEISWIIWPIAGVAFGTFAAVVSSVYPSPHQI